MAEDLDLVKIDRMSSQERVDSKIHGLIFDWITGDSKTSPKTRFIELHDRGRSLGRDLALAEVQRDIAIALNIFVADEVHHEWDKELTQVFLDRSRPDSIINCCGRDEEAQFFVERHLIGAFSVLTLADLLREACPDRIEGVQLSRIITSPAKDVKYTTDLDIRFGDKNQDYYDAPVVRLVQLKSNARGGLGMWGNHMSTEVIEGENLGTTKVGNYLTENERANMSKLAKRIADSAHPQLLDTDNIFLVIVPAYDSPPVRNIFGIIQKDREKYVRLFESVGRRVNLLPPRKK